MRKFTKAIILGMASATLLVAACSGGGEAKAPAAGGAASSAGGAGTSATLTLMDISYSTNALSGTAGQPLTVNITNSGALDHDFTIDKIAGTATLDGKDAKATGQDVHAPFKAKGTGKVVITPSAAGTYEFYCTVAGHKDAGMKGTLTVK